MVVTMMTKTKLNVEKTSNEGIMIRNTNEKISEKEDMHRSRRSNNELNKDNISECISETDPIIDMGDKHSYDKNENFITKGILGNISKPSECNEENGHWNTLTSSQKDIWNKMDSQDWEREYQTAKSTTHNEQVQIKEISEPIKIDTFEENNLTKSQVLEWNALDSQTLEMVTTQENKMDGHKCKLNCEQMQTKELSENHQNNDTILTNSQETEWNKLNSQTLDLLTHESPKLIKSNNKFSSEKPGQSATPSQTCSTKRKDNNAHFFYSRSKEMRSTERKRPVTRSLSLSRQSAGVTPKNYEATKIETKSKKFNFIKSTPTTRQTKLTRMSKNTPTTKNIDPSKIPLPSTPVNLKDGISLNT